MNIHQKPNCPTYLSRRSILKAAAGLTIAFYLPPLAKAQTAVPAADARFAPNAFIRVAPDNTVTVISKHIEMGQGPYTGLATIVAEELDADWSQMRVEGAPADNKLYNNLAFGPIQGTGGSSAIANSFDQLRNAGASARAMLVQAAADRWKVAPSSITVTTGVVSHAASKRQATFGELAQAAAKVSAPANVVLKKPEDFTLIGKEGATKRLDMADKVNGKAKFTIDINEPNMLTVLVAHPPRFGGKVGSVDDAEARKIPGVVDVKVLSSGVAVYANGTWPAMKGREALKITWDESAAEKRGTPELLAEYRAATQKTGIIAGKEGDAPGALSKAAKVIEAEYVFPYLAHAPMEPLNGFIVWDGQQVSAKYGCQFQTIDQGAMAKVFGITPDKVKIEMLLAGGSFGRRAQAVAELPTELAEAAKAIGPNKPIKLVRTRDDDIRGGHYRPMFVHKMKGAVENGKIVAWSDTVVGQSFMADGPMAGMIKNGIDPTQVEGSNDLPYVVENFQCDLHTMKVGVPTLWWRSVGHTHTAYAVEAFIDELLQAAGKDPVEGRLELMTKPKSKRLAGALKAVAELAKWTGPNVGNGRARGVAAVESFKTFVAQIAEVSIGPNGEPRVHKVWCAVDCGVAVNPDIIRAQMEGGIGFGLGHVLYADVPLDGGRVVPKNFDSYRSLRINEMPEIEVVIVKSSEKPTGVGEPGVPPIGPAIANAMARLGAQRPGSLPIVPSVRSV